MEQLKSVTGQSSVLSLMPALALAFLLSACQMPSPTSSSGQSGPSGPSGGGMPSPPSGGSSSPSGSSAPPSGPPSAGEQGAGSQEGSAGNQEGSSGSQEGSSGSQEGSSGSEQGESSSKQEGAGSEDGSTGSAQGESVEGLDAQLDASLEGFDDSMGGSSSQGPDEIDILSPSGSTGVAADSDEPLFEEADSGIPSEGNTDIEQAAQQGPEGSEGESGSPGAPGAEGPEGEGASGGGQQQADAAVIPIPDDIDDGQGDDIVLRQIRDAAMREKDPVLRERLWDEYRRIKNQ